VTTTTWQPVTALRRTLEVHVLGTHDAAGNLNPEATWPGVYLLPDGSRTPAVYVTGESMVPSNWTVQGIETTIDDLPSYTTPGSVGGVLSTEEWTIRFTNYGNRSGTEMTTTLRDISRRLARAFPRARTTPMPRTEATYEALTAYIRETFLNPPIP
jgi:hypothetical protein